jgi:hypothetical protein
MDPTTRFLIVQRRLDERRTEAAGERLTRHSRPKPGTRQHLRWSPSDGPLTSSAPLRATLTER